MGFQNLNSLKNPLRQAELVLLVLTCIFIIIPFVILPSKDEAIKNLCPQYILISTALMAIIFAALTIKHDKITIERFRFPLFLSTLSLLTDIYTYFLYWLNSSSWNVILLFSVATILIFSLILEIALMAAQLLLAIKNNSSIE